jgi:hypothetical protein
MSMKVCDICKRVDHKKHRPQEVNVAVIKQEERSKKLVPREMVTIPVDLCESCISDFLSRLGSWIQKIREEVPLPPTSVDLSKEYSRIDPSVANQKAKDANIVKNTGEKPLSAEEGWPSDSVEN